MAAVMSALPQRQTTPLMTIGYFLLFNVIFFAPLFFLRGSAERTAKSVERN
jgi:hypothetical protein